MEKKLKTFTVFVPFTGVFAVEVEASDEKDAVDAVWESPDLELECDTLDNISEFSFHSTIVEGNVFRGCQNEIRAEESK